MKTCPECENPTDAELAFCQHCGLRLRPTVTVREGLPALRRPKLSERDVPRGEAGRKGTDLSSVETQRELSPLARELSADPDRIEEDPAEEASRISQRVHSSVLGAPAREFMLGRSLPPAVEVADKHAAYQSVHRPSSRRDSEEETAIKDERGTEDNASGDMGRVLSHLVDDAVQSARETQRLDALDASMASTSSSSLLFDGEVGRADAVASASSGSSLYVHHPPTPRYGFDKRLFLALLLAWTGITGLGVLVLYHMLSKPADSHPTDEVFPHVGQVVPIAEGAFLKGLSDSTQSFVLQICAKVMENAGEVCSQDRLLRGEYPQETVHVGAFKMDVTEVTHGMYQRCKKEGNCSALNNKECRVYTSQGYQAALRVPRVSQQGSRPVNCVTREQAQTYCRWRQGALPTPEQWEKAARGSDALLFPWGSVWKSDVANWGEVDVVRTPVPGRIDGYQWSAPPGSFSEGESPYGLQDMAGNVAEWVMSADPRGGEVRGGSWADTPFDLRTTRRLKMQPTMRRADVGFRCVYAADPVP